MNHILKHSRSFLFRKLTLGKRAGDEFALSAQMMISRTWQWVRGPRLQLIPLRTEIRKRTRSTMRRDSNLLRKFGNQL